MEMCKDTITTKGNSEGFSNRSEFITTILLTTL